ncbi:MAG: T9SS type A sorting domain-containing protein [Bacteroidota bacterium]
MIIKKNINHQPEKNNIQTRLDAYARQGKSYRKTHRGRMSGPSLFLKSSLAAVIPLAAAGVLHAQTGCENTFGTLTLNFQSNSAANASDTKTFTVAGQEVFLKGRQFGAPFFQVFSLSGNNIQFYGQTNTYNNRINSKSPGFVVTRSLSIGSNKFFNDGFLCDNYRGYYTYSSWQSDCGTLNVAIRQTNVSPNRPGWITIEFLPPQGGQLFLSRFKISQRGVEDPANTPTNSAEIGDCSTIEASLPVELTHFRTSPHDKHIQLDWATASELNNEGFEVQRSTDGSSFSKIGWVEGQGTTHESQTYRFIDDEAQSNIKYYYRLRQMDTNGSESFSPVRSATVMDNDAFHVSDIFPNPLPNGRQVARFRLHAPTEGVVAIQLFDVRGSQLKTFERQHSAGHSTLAIPVTDLAAGQYFVKMQMGQEVVYRKLVVK